MAFSGAIKLTDLNDFISPSQECIKPVQPPSVQIHPKTKSVTEAAKIDLNDCLACSGCITSAEAVLVSSQGIDKFVAELENRCPDEIIIVTVSPQTRASFAAKHNLTADQVVVGMINFFKSLGVDVLLDSNIARSVSLLNIWKEYVGFRDKSKMMLSSVCPGWICYVEKTHPELIGHLSRTTSPQQTMGILLKDELFCDRKVYNVSVMPCYDKKLEASRDEFAREDERYVDLVLTTGEIESLMITKNVDISSWSEIGVNKVEEPGNMSNLEGFKKYILNFDSFLYFSRLSHYGSTSGGYLEMIVKGILEEAGFDATRGLDCSNVKLISSKSKDFEEYLIQLDNKEIKVARVNGFRNIQNLMRRFKRSLKDYSFVEVMACPSGCINGGGQLKMESLTQTKELVSKAEIVYNNSFKVEPIDYPFSNLLMQILKEKIFTSFKSIKISKTNISNW
ncbi:iron hydrogenase [Rozella allomycis CSF55]|uniref:Iron hydrogenase n=1 Tax=Rozella allomycis (strain CSF55) TaxID=988480 RepID=A0A4P9YD09_ROZAC|nr:iron hydrogenase [Rozella allomycis CSF55]